jgi:cytolysin (calcineurin-like family phosphatase)
MGYVKYQSKLSRLPRKQVGTPFKPSFLIDWKNTRPELKKFILLHLIRVVDDYRSPHTKLTFEKLITDLSFNMGGIVKLQVKLYIENLIYYGYISESYVDGMVTVTDKAYDELFFIDKILLNKKKQQKGVL